MANENYGMVGKNWRGQQVHPVDTYTWFRTTDQDREKLIKMYDELALGDKERAKLLDSLIEEMRHIAVLEFEFNQGDC
jgi:adenine-specific DNA methylase